MLFVLRFLIFLCALVLLYTVLFHLLMRYEGRDYSMFAGLYWTLTVMSTSAFGDITFRSDPGMIFTVTVLMSGVLLFMLLLPFIFIRYIYIPWADAHNKVLTPRMLPEDCSGHVVIIGSDGTVLSIASRCLRYGISYVLFEADNAKAVSLYNRGYKVVLGETDSVSGYAAVRAEKAALVLALHDDMKNTKLPTLCANTPPGPAGGKREPGSLRRHSAPRRMRPCAGLRRHARQKPCRTRIRRKFDLQRHRALQGLLHCGMWLLP